MHELDYGCIVAIGVGDAEAMGDIVGVGCADALSAVAPAISAAARIRPTNHLFIELVPPWLKKSGSHGWYPRADPA